MSAFCPLMTSTLVVETSVNGTSKSPSQDYTHPDDHNLLNYDMTPGFNHLQFCPTSLNTAAAVITCFGTVS